MLQVIKAEEVRDGERCGLFRTMARAMDAIAHLKHEPRPLLLWDRPMPVGEFPYAIVDRPAPTPAVTPGLDLDAMERAERAMTAGPWRMHGYAAEIVDADDETVARLDMRGDRITGGDARGFSDAAGIVALRNTAPALIAEVRALRAKLAEAKRLGLEFAALHREAGNCDGWGPFPEMRSKRMAAIAAALGAL